MLYREWIESMRLEWTGARVLYEGQEYTVTDVDYNGGLLIDKPARFTDTTAVGTWMVTRVREPEDFLDDPDEFLDTYNAIEDEYERRLMRMRSYNLL